MARPLVIFAVVTLVAACGDPRPATEAPGVQVTVTEVTDVTDVATSSARSTSTISTGPSTTTTPRSTSSTTTGASATTTSTTSSTTTSVTPESTPYVVPVADVAGAGWSDTHAAYPATDIFNNGCGGAVVAPVNGQLLEVRRVDGYDPAIDNPATRGGRSISMLGDDGVRYYLAHFEQIATELAPGGRVEAGQEIGTIGSTGRSSACHLHFGISPPCPDPEWSVRRGVVWPARYLDDWRIGTPTSPADEVAAFVADRPTACAEAAADEFADDAS